MPSSCSSTLIATVAVKDRTAATCFNGDKTAVTDRRHNIILRFLLIILNLINKFLPMKFDGVFVFLDVCFLRLFIIVFACCVDAVEWMVVVWL